MVRCPADSEVWAEMQAQVEETDRAKPGCRSCGHPGKRSNSRGGTSASAHTHAGCVRWESSRVMWVFAGRKSAGTARVRTREARKWS